MSDFVKGASPRDQRLPVQGRAQERMARVFQAAEKLLVDRGPEGTSIPEIALAADVPRASIYQYFPDKYALLAHLAKVHMDGLKAHVLAIRPNSSSTDWQTVVRSLARATASYYNANPTTSVLLLKGPFGDQDRAAQRAKDDELATQFRLILTSDRKSPRFPKKPDVIAIAIELAFAVMRYGYAREGNISRAIADEAARAAIAYLSAHA